MKYIYPFLLSTFLIYSNDAFAMKGRNPVETSDQKKAKNQNRLDVFLQELEEGCPKLLKEAEALIPILGERERESIESSKGAIQKFYEKTKDAIHACRTAPSAAQDPCFVSYLTYFPLRETLVVAINKNTHTEVRQYFSNMFNYINQYEEHLSPQEMFYFLTHVCEGESIQWDPNFAWSKILQLKRFSLACLEATKLDDLDISRTFKQGFGLFFDKFKKQLNTIPDDLLSQCAARNLNPSNDILKSIQLINSFLTTVCGISATSLLLTQKQPEICFPVNQIFNIDGKMYQLPQDEIARNMTRAKNMWKHVVWTIEPLEQFQLYLQNPLRQEKPKSAVMLKKLTLGEVYKAELKKSHDDLWHTERAVQKMELPVKYKENVNALFSKCFASMRYAVNGIYKATTHSSTNLEIDSSTLIPYCVQFPLRKGLHEVLATEDLSEIHEHAQKALDALGIFERYSSNETEFLIKNLDIQLTSNKNPFVPVYEIRFNARKAIVNLRAKARNLYLIADHIRLDKLHLPKEYESRLATKLKEMKDKVLKISFMKFGAKFWQDPAWKTTSLDLASEKTTEFLRIQPKLQEIVGIISEATPNILNPLFVPIFKDDYGTLLLTLAEATERLPLWDQMCMSMPVNKPAFKEPVQKKEVKKKKKQQPVRTPQHKPKETKKGSLLTQETPTVLETEPALQPSKLAAVEPASISSAVQPKTEVSVVSEIETPQKPREELIVWLQDIMKQSAVDKEKCFHIFGRAYALSRQLSQHPDLFETEESLRPLQDIAQGLCDQMSHIQKKSKVIKKERIAVPFRALPLYLSFMESSVSDLVGIRFGRVRTLFESLGIKIDTSRAGSRVHFEYGNHATSIHIHDKHDEPLEGGRISSLRKFLWEIGFTTDDGDEEDDQ